MLQLDTDSQMQGSADVCFVGRQFQKNPFTVRQFAEDLGVDVFMAWQWEWPLYGRGDAVVRRMAHTSASNGQL